VVDWYAAKVLEGIFTYTGAGATVSLEKISTSQSVIGVAVSKRMER
jgi:hypothetical protein